MKPLSKRSLTLLLTVVSLATQFANLFAQGSLNPPPGAPAPTMKTLDQLDTHLSQVGTNVLQLSNQVSQVSKTLSGSEPRYPISDFGTNLTVSGSYYLIADLFSGSSTGDAITIRTNMSNMTIDLNGFSIISTNPPGTDSPVGIRISAATNIVIRNGQFSGFDRAVRCEGLFYGIVVDNVHVLNCHRAGIEGNGVAGDASQTITVRQCVIDGVNATGESTTQGVAADGIVILNCTGVVDSCVIRDITPALSGGGTCINAFTATNTFINNNFMSHSPIGLNVTGGGTRVYYRNNLTSGCTTPFGISGGVDRGGNF